MEKVFSSVAKNLASSWKEGHCGWSTEWSGAGDQIMKALNTKGRGLDSNCNGKPLDNLKQEGYLMDIPKTHAVVSSMEYRGASMEAGRP